MFVIGRDGDIFGKFCFVVDWFGFSEGKEKSMLH